MVWSLMFENSCTWFRYLRWSDIRVAEPYLLSVNENKLSAYEDNGLDLRRRGVGSANRDG